MTVRGREEEAAAAGGVRLSRLRMRRPARRQESDQSVPVSLSLVALSFFDNYSSQRIKLSKREGERKAAWPELKLAQIRRLQCLLSLLSLSSVAASSLPSSLPSFFSQKVVLPSIKAAKVKELMEGMSPTNRPQSQRIAPRVGSRRRLSYLLKLTVLITPRRSCV